MDRLPPLVSGQLNKSFVRYLFVGGSTVVLDVSLLVFFREICELNLALSASLAYWVSIAYNFVLNRWWSFSAGEMKSMHRHLAAYLLLLGFNYGFTVITVTQLSEHIDYVLAKILAILVQVTWTYYIYNNYIFVKGKS